MIDCSIDIDDLMMNHPEDARSTFGIGEEDNLIILAPDDGSGCIFLNNRVDDYTGAINVFIFTSIKYIPTAVYYMSNGGMIREDVSDTIDENNRIYRVQIKENNYTCSSDNGFQVVTARQRFLVDVHICEGGDDKVSIRNGSRYVGYGDNATLTAAIIDDPRTYMVSWTDVTDPEHPLPLTPDTYASRQDENRQDYSRIATSTCTLRNITSDRSIEVCYQRIPKEYTFRLFTNDGKIKNLDLNRMVDDYKLGDVSVTFTVNNEPITISTANYIGYGIVQTYDFMTNTFDVIEYPETDRHYFDRGIILYHVTDMHELTISSTVYEVDCTYMDCTTEERDCEKLLPDFCENTKTQYTSFLGWVKTPGDPNNYNNLSLCSLHYHTFQWEQIEEPNVLPAFIHEQESLGSEVKCSDFYYNKANQYYVPATGPVSGWQGHITVTPEEFDDYIPFPDDFTIFNEYYGEYRPADYVVVDCWITETYRLEKIFVLEDETPGYFSRSLVSGDIDMPDTCYTYEDDWGSEFTTTFSNDTTLYAVFKPTTSDISFEIDNRIEREHTIGIIDYCNSYKYVEITSSQLPYRPIQYASLPLTVDENSPEYIRVDNVPYRKQRYYRETGVTSSQTLTFKEMNGTYIYLSAIGEQTDPLQWDIKAYDENHHDYARIKWCFNGKAQCAGIPLYECNDFEFAMCGDINFKLEKQQ